MYTLEKHEQFDKLYDILFKTYIAQYQEFDQSGHCYFSLEHIIPVPNETGTKPIIQLIDTKTGKHIHDVIEESDFHFFTVEHIESLIHIEIFFKSEYRYELYAKKL